MYNQYANNTNTGFVAAANHSAFTTQPAQTQMSQSFVGPSKLLHLDVTRQCLGNASLSEAYLLELSRQAILYGYLEQHISDGVIYNHVSWNNLVFILTHAFDAVVLIQYAHGISKAAPVKPQPQPQFQPHAHVQPDNIFRHAEDSEEYELIINEIVDSVEKDMQAEHALAFYSASNEQAKMQTPPPSAPTTAQPPQPQPQRQRQAPSETASRKSASPTPPAECSHRGTSYHTIYLKPIMERLAKCEPTAQVTGDYVAEIVSSALRFGDKRQISKRTFSFTWQRYTVVMSKSLRTILDVAVSREGQSNADDVVTVHPDVVSILAKKCPSLDYFAIQRIAEEAKRAGSFTTKKNDYRQQFIYDFAGYRIVFASNHSTIVEMQCSEQATPSTTAVHVL